MVRVPAELFLVPQIKPGISCKEHAQSQATALVALVKGFNKLLKMKKSCLYVFIKIQIIHCEAQFHNE